MEQSHIRVIDPATATVEEMDEWIVAGQPSTALNRNSGVSPASWKDFYGSLRHLHGEREKIEAVIEEEFEQVDDRQINSIAEAVQRDDELTAGVVVGREHGEVMRAARQRLGCA